MCKTRLGRLTYCTRRSFHLVSECVKSVPGLVQAEFARSSLLCLLVLLDGLSSQAFQPLLLPGFDLSQVCSVQAVGAWSDNNGLVV